MQGKITKTAVDALRPGDILADNEVKGFVVRRLPSGVITYGLRYRAPGGQRWLALGLHGKITPAEARKLAKKRAGQVADDRDPAKEREADRENAKLASASTVNALLDAFLARYVRKNLRSAGEVERVFDKYVRPRLGNKSIYELRRQDITEMLDVIEDENGSVMSDRTLAHVRKAFNWQATRDDTFVPPIVRGMARTKPKERARKRILSDEEIRDMWRALEVATVPSCFPAFVRTLLLVAARREEVSCMSWDEVDGDTWTIPAERGDRQGHKTADQTGNKVVPLTVDVELQQSGGMIRRSTGCRRIDTIKAQLAKIECIDERIDCANRIALVDKVIEAFRQQRRLSPICPFHEALHRLPPQIARRIITATAFLRSQGPKRT